MLASFCCYLVFTFPSSFFPLCLYMCMSYICIHMVAKHHLWVSSSFILHLTFLKQNLSSPPSSNPPVSVPFSSPSPFHSPDMRLTLSANLTNLRNLSVLPPALDYRHRLSAHVYRSAREANTVFFITLSHLSRSLTSEFSIQINKPRITLTLPSARHKMSMYSCHI